MNRVVVLSRFCGCVDGIYDEDFHFTFCFDRGL